MFRLNLFLILLTVIKPFANHSLAQLLFVSFPALDHCFSRAISTKVSSFPNRFFSHFRYFKHSFHTVEWQQNGNTFFEITPASELDFPTARIVLEIQLSLRSHFHNNFPLSCWHSLVWFLSRLTCSLLTLLILALITIFNCFCYSLVI